MLTIALSHSVDATECDHQAAAGLRRSGGYTTGQPPRQTLPLRLRRRGSRACPARHGTRPAPRLAGPSRPTLGPSALAGQRLAVATALGGLVRVVRMVGGPLYKIYTHTTSLEALCVLCLRRNCNAWCGCALLFIRTGPWCACIVYTTPLTPPSYIILYA